MSILSNVKKVLAIAVIAAPMAPVLANSLVDGTTTEQIRQLLNQAPELHADMLRVDVEGGTIYIRGAVDTLIESAKIDALASSVPGYTIVNATDVVSAGN